MIPNDIFQIFYTHEYGSLLLVRPGSQNVWGRPWFLFSCGHYSSSTLELWDVRKDKRRMRIFNASQLFLHLIIGCLGQLASTDYGAVELINRQIPMTPTFADIRHSWNLTFRPLGGTPFSCYPMPKWPNPLGLFASQSCRFLNPCSVYWKLSRKSYINASLWLQGAVENLLERSTSVQLLDGSVVELDQNSKNVILEALHGMSTSALRCLGFAYKDDLSDFETYDGDEDHPAHQLLLNPSNYSSIESDLTFVGLVGLRVSKMQLCFILLYLEYVEWGDSE